MNCKANTTRPVCETSRRIAWRACFGAFARSRIAARECRFERVLQSAFVFAKAPLLSPFASSGRIIGDFNRGGGGGYSLNQNVFRKIGFGPVVALLHLALHISFFAPQIAAASVPVEHGGAAIDCIKSTDGGLYASSGGWRDCIVVMSPDFFVPRGRDGFSTKGTRGAISGGLLSCAFQQQ